jgi:hypothetical protein
MTDSDDLGHQTGDNLSASPGRGKRALGKARQAAAGGIDQASALAERSYDRARALAGQAPDALSEQISRAPLTSVLVAALLGLVAGWTLRGSVDR